MATVPEKQRFSGRRLVLHGIPWKTYIGLSRLLQKGRRNVRMTYDRGTLEIMTITHEHENCAWFLGRLVAVLTEELDLPLHGGGSTTFRRRDMEKGLEADECFWIPSEPLVRGKKKLDLRKDPPPDLAFEVDVTHRSVKRLPIYAAIKVPEVWRYETERLQFLNLTDQGMYEEVAVSKMIPGLTPGDLLPFLKMREQMDENAVIRQFRAWVRERFQLDRRM